MVEGTAVDIAIHLCASHFAIFFRFLGTPLPLGSGTQNYWRETLSFATGYLKVDQGHSG